MYDAVCCATPPPGLLCRGTPRHENAAQPPIENAALIPASPGTFYVGTLGLIRKAKR